MYFIVWWFLLAGCAPLDDINIQYIAPERNENCQDIAEVEIFQTLNGYALASVCDHKGDTFCLGMTVRVNEYTEPLYDKKRVSAPNGKCIVFNETYKYETKDNSIKTVPVIDFEYEYLATNEEETVNRILATHTDIKKSCVLEMNKEFKDLMLSVKEERCECLADEIMKILFENAENNKELKLDAKAIEKKCGKLPKSIK